MNQEASPLSNAVAVVDLREHWQNIYRMKAPSEVSWYQPEARTSLRLIRSVAPSLVTPIIDVGGGASTLVDGLLDGGYRDISVLDLASAGLERAQERLGPRADRVGWIPENVLEFTFPRVGYGVWHDRGAFHFLTNAADRARYIDRMKSAVRSGGHVIVASFGVGGPAKCSGLDVVRYSPESMQAEFGAGFRMVEYVDEEHRTPAGNLQLFIYCCFRKD